MNHTDRDEPFDFPCRFPIKAIGSGDDLDLIVCEIIRRHAPNLGESAVSTRSSSKGNYTAVTVTITAESRQQLDNIYLELTAHDRITMAL